ncbi:MAG: formate dehydrogenase accessory sulfurtransferase FdhD [Desulfuromonadales bacterium]
MIKYDKGAISEVHDELPVEQPVKLTVNGREIATLVASPHELGFLVAGFLRTQGFVREVGDVQVLGVCDQSGEANVRIRGEIPEKLTPVLTSGCGTGISFSLNAGPLRTASPEARFPATAVFAMMREMGRLSKRYENHGGIHSAAVSDGKSIIFHAEDLGRHNTIDRLAGQALLSGRDLAGTMLLTSGRVSAEMAAKAASLGVALIASRTSPTDMALRICREAGIGLLGYVRGESFRIAACPERLLDVAVGRIPGVAAIILAGGESRRMGTNKALLTVGNRRIIETVYDRVAELFDEVILVTNDPDEYDFIPCLKIKDIHAGLGPLGGIHAGLTHCSAGRAFVTACDMPALDATLIRELCSISADLDVIIPETPGGLEPLHSVYSRSCLPKMEKMLQNGERRILSFLELASTRLVPRGRIAQLDPHFTSFSNINTPEDYQKINS